MHIEEILNFSEEVMNDKYLHIFFGYKMYFTLVWI